jgi:hypothetical protein
VFICTLRLEDRLARGPRLFALSLCFILIGCVLAIPRIQVLTNTLLQIIGSFGLDLLVSLYESKNLKRLHILNILLSCLSGLHAKVRSLAEDTVV